MQYNRILNEEQAGDDPFSLFVEWFTDALNVLPESANAMVLSTTAPSGQPSARVVLLKDFGEHGFSFYTNYKSHKAKQLEANPKASLLFYWDMLHRQIRIEGLINKAARETSELYFATRDHSSQLGAHASMQSATLASRKELEDEYEKLEKKFAGKNIPCPKHWGGYLLVPHYMEFWQGQAYRLHDRLAFTLSAKDQDKWERKRLAP